MSRWAMWGTGAVAGNLLEQHPSWSPDFFIDNDLEKTGGIYHGKQIFHPSDITEWDGLRILVATDYFQEIERQLREKGVFKKVALIPYQEAASDSGTLSQLISEAAHFADRVPVEGLQGKIWVFGDFVSYDKGVCGYLNSLDERLGGRLVLFSEADYIGPEQIKKRVAFPFYEMPAMLRKNHRFPKNTGACSTHSKSQTDKQFHLRAASQLLRAGYGLDGEHARLVCHYMDLFITKLLEKAAPESVILWNQFYALHTVIDYACKRREIPVRYMEFGVLPGTFTVETAGQMGESRPARNAENFMKLAVSEQEMEAAEIVWDFLYATGLNRNKQVSGDLAPIRRLVAPGAPVILFAGQNEYESGMQPYTERSRRFHSPMFATNLEALKYLAALAAKNGWNLIYKPHPVMEKFSSDRCYPENAIVVKYANINDLIDFSDLCITILSQVGYIACIRKKPVLMCGYTQLKGKGAVYEAFRNEELENRILEALRNGYKKSQEEAFRKHVAQLVKYYLFDDLTERPLRYGKGQEALAQSLRQERFRIADHRALYKDGEGGDLW